MFFTCRLRHPKCVPLCVPDDRSTADGNKYRSGPLIMTKEPEGFEAHDSLLSLYNNLKDLKDIHTLKNVEDELSNQGKLQEWTEFKVS